jgi:DNA (cytosine-5)-methyltransferase 1
MKMKKIKVGSDFSGVGAFNQALKRLGVDYHEVFACDMDKYARKTFIHNYGEPDYYPENVYDREIPTESLDIYMTSPPCQAFSLAGKRLGKDDKRGILFFNSHEFIRVNKPRYFIFENVKGLLSDDGGRTFNEWINMLGGKSVNGNAVMFQYDDAVPYHIYWKVLNAKEHGVPQNRERVFIIGIRDDADNTFRFPAEEFLTKRLKDVLDDDVDEKYFLSEKMVDVLSHHKNPIIDNQTPKKSATIHAGYFKMGGRDQQYIKVTNFQGNDICNTIRTGGKGSLNDKHNWDIIKVKSATSKGYEIAEDGDSINYSVPNSETRRGRVGKQVAQTLDTGCNQGVVIPLFHYGNGKSNERMVYDSNGICPCMVSAMGMGGGYTPAVIQLNPSKESGGQQPYQQNRIYDSNGICPALNAGQETWGGNAITMPDSYSIRRLTPRECFRLMDFPDTFDFSVVSDSQAYKQAGNSIVVNVLYKIIKNLNL